VFLATIVLLFFANKGAGVFFTQDRPGKNEKIFKALKFKTMTDERDANGNLLPDADRLTPVGKFVRSTSIDELPQLINILKGDMAFIGPRPLLAQYLPLYSEEQHRRLDVTPGMSGWAQVPQLVNITGLGTAVENPGLL
jgi:lipopolysaccharide/colanic/teichoic acid biosynthesis glycosyltransferase